MKQSQGSDTRKRELIEKPSFAVLAKGEGHAWTGGAEAGPSLEARIREAAYARYENRGRVHGHDVEDWLAAEAALTGERSAAGSRAVASTH